MKSCVIFANTFKTEAVPLASSVKFFLEKRGIKSQIIFVGTSQKDEFSHSNFDFAISLGGDGTVLYACRKCAPLKKPVFPVNLGEFGFIASVQKNSWEKSLEDFLHKKSQIEKRSMIFAEVFFGEKKIASKIALNDIVLAKESGVGTVSFEVSHDGVPLGKIKADGIVVSTPTGSTAYSASAGGPIIDPKLSAILLTILNPFSLSSRPVVLGAKGALDVKFLPSRAKKIFLRADGSTAVELEENSLIKIGKTSFDALLVGCTREKFYGALRSKMNWMGEPHA